MTDIHATAVVAEGASIGEGVTIGPYCVIGENVVLQDGVELKSHVVIDGWTTVGKDARIFSFAAIGTETQDLKYDGARTEVFIGERTMLREYVTVNSGTNEGDVTRVGDDCLFMAYSHVAHQCLVGNEVIIANCGTLAGHVVVEDKVVIGGLSGVHQFTRLGTMSIVGGCSKIVQDVMPYMMVDGHPAKTRGLNSIGLKRRGMSPDVRKRIKKAYALLCRDSLSTQQALEQIENSIEGCDEIRHLMEFVRESERGITK